MLSFLLFPFIISCVLEVGIGKFRAWNQNCCFSSTFSGEQGSCLHAFGHLSLLCVFKVLSMILVILQFLQLFLVILIFLLFSSFFSMIQLGCDVVSFPLSFFVCEKLK